jgi:hypothetical protein
MDIDYSNQNREREFIFTIRLYSELRYLVHGYVSEPNLQWGWHA